jgi:hypothetical protein
MNLAAKQNGLRVNKRKQAQSRPINPYLTGNCQVGGQYKVDVSLIIETLDAEEKRTETRDVRTVADTGAAPMIVRLGALPEGVEIFPLTEAPLLVDAQRKAIALLGVVTCRFQLGENCYAMSALVAEDLSVDLILGTQFIDALVRPINPRRNA